MKVSALYCRVNVVWRILISDARTSSFGGFYTNTSTFVCSIADSLDN